MFGQDKPPFLQGTNTCLWREESKKTGDRDEGGALGEPHPLPGSAPEKPYVRYFKFYVEKVLWVTHVFLG